MQSYPSLVVPDGHIIRHPTDSEPLPLVNRSDVPFNDPVKCSKLLVTVSRDVADTPPEISRLTVEEAAHALGITTGAVRNRLSRGSFYLDVVPK